MTRIRTTRSNTAWQWNTGSRKANVGNNTQRADKLTLTIHGSVVHTRELIIVRHSRHFNLTLFTFVSLLLLLVFSFSHAVHRYMQIPTANRASVTTASASLPHKVRYLCQSPTYTTPELLYRTYASNISQCLYDFTIVYYVDHFAQYMYALGTKSTVPLMTAVESTWLE